MQERQQRARMQMRCIVEFALLAVLLPIPVRLVAQTRGASWRPSSRIDYPPVLLKYRMFGQVDAGFVIDERGRVDTTTFDIVAPSSSPIFASAVKQAILDGDAKPALVNGHRTRQRLRHVFIFAPPDHVACSDLRLPQTPDVTVICAPKTR